MKQATVTHKRASSLVGHICGIIEDVRQTWGIELKEGDFMFRPCIFKCDIFGHFTTWCGWPFYAVYLILLLGLIRPRQQSKYGWTPWSKLEEVYRCGKYKILITIHIVGPMAIVAALFLSISISIYCLVRLVAILLIRRHQPASRSRFRLARTLFVTLATEGTTTTGISFCLGPG
jgi:hypothetical protein